MVRAAAAGDPEAEFVLLVPATPVSHLGAWTEGESHAVASAKALAARERLENVGVNVVDARVGEPDPYVAVLTALSDEDFDEILVSTFAPGISRWLKADLISRLRDSIDLPVTHVIAH